MEKQTIILSHTDDIKRALNCAHNEKSFSFGGHYYFITDYKPRELFDDRPVEYEITAVKIETE